MIRYLVIFVIVFILLLAGFITLRGRALPEADFTYAIAMAIKTLDPAQMSLNDEIRMAIGLWEGLASYDPRTLKPISGVAYLPPAISDDGRTYRFKLRAEARWSNNDKVTADDFVYGWRRAIEPGTAAGYAFLITDNIAGAKAYSDWRNEAVGILIVLRDLAGGVKIDDKDRQLLNKLNLPGSDSAKPDWQEIAQRFRQEHLGQIEEKFSQVAIKALDPYHLQVTLVRPTAYFLDLVAFSTFMPIHRQSIEKLRVKDNRAVTDLTLWSYDEQWVKPDYYRNGYGGLVSNGPFVLKDWQFKRYMLFEKNPRYWDKANVKSNRIMARIIPDAGTTFLLYERGDIDLFGSLPRLDLFAVVLEMMRSGKRDDIHLNIAFGTYFYHFNCKKQLHDGSINPFADAQVRMAFNLAIDKQAIVDKVQKIGNPVARNFVPPGSIDGYYCEPGPDYDTERARKLLAQAGYPKGQGFPVVDLLYNTAGGHEKTAQAVAQMWYENLNVKVSLRGKEWKTFDVDRKKQRFMICRAGWYGDYSDPTTFLDMLVTDNGQNHSAFSYPPYDELMRKAADCGDSKERMKILAQAETILMAEQMPNLPIYHYINLLSFRDNVKGLIPNARDINPFKYLYCE